MDEKLIHLEDGTTVEAKINFATIYYMKKFKVDALLEKQEQMEKDGEELLNDDQMELMARMLHVILLSNGRKCTFEDALVLLPLDDIEFEDVIKDFGEKVEKYKKKREAKLEMRKYTEQST